MCSYKIDFFIFLFFFDIWTSTWTFYGCIFFGGYMLLVHQGAVSIWDKNFRESFVGDRCNIKGGKSNLMLNRSFWTKHSLFRFESNCLSQNESSTSMIWLLNWLSLNIVQHYPQESGNMAILTAPVPNYLSQGGLLIV